MATRPTEKEIEAVKAAALARGFDEVFEVATGKADYDYAVLYRPLTEKEGEALLASKDGARKQLTENLIKDCVLWPAVEELPKVWKKRPLFRTTVENALMKTSGFDSESLGKKL